MQQQCYLRCAPSVSGVAKVSCEIAVFCTTPASSISQALHTVIMLMTKCFGSYACTANSKSHGSCCQSASGVCARTMLLSFERKAALKQPPYSSRRLLGSCKPGKPCCAVTAMVCAAGGSTKYAWALFYRLYRRPARTAAEPRFSVPGVRLATLTGNNSCSNLTLKTHRQVPPAATTVTVQQHASRRLLCS